MWRILQIVKVITICDNLGFILLPKFLFYYCYPFPNAIVGEATLLLVAKHFPDKAFQRGMISPGLYS